MKQNISFCGFCDAFPESRENSFSYDGKKALFEYLESYEDDTGEEVELDIVALCCEYCEYESIEDYAKDYNLDLEDYQNEFDGLIFDDDKFNYGKNEFFDWLNDNYKEEILNKIQDNTTLINLDNNGFIIQCY